MIINRAFLGDNKVLNRAIRKMNYCDLHALHNIYVKMVKYDCISRWCIHDYSVRLSCSSKQMDIYQIKASH